MDEFIYKLQKDNKIKERERNEAQKVISKKEKEIAALRARLEAMEAKGVGRNEEEINVKVNERIQVVKVELEKKLKDYQRMADDFVESERRKMEEKMMKQQKEVETIRKRLREIEYGLVESGVKEMDGGRLAKRLMGVYSSADAAMVKSMDLDMDDQGQSIHEDKLVGGGNSNSFLDKLNKEVSDRGGLGTVLEEEEVIDEKRVVSIIAGLPKTSFDKEESAFSRRSRIQNIFTLCGNKRKLSQHIQVPEKSPVKIIGKENYNPKIDSGVDELIDLHVK